MKVKIFIGEDPGFEVDVGPEQTLIEITDVIKQVKRNDNIRMSLDFIKNKGWKIAESIQTNGVLEGHALAFEVVDPNAGEALLDEYQEEEKTVLVVEPTVEELIK